MKYRFKRMYRQYQPGDPVPDTYGKGVISAFLLSGTIEPVTAANPPAVKDIQSPPVNKMIEAPRGRKAARA